ncbi:Bgt-3997 [Blumeria graminis f. sp. tritici]|uniref:Bgt-3997 n=2 Tax=Blumeria graminis f. sp. tritici TaxID=62690 RepID=A0A061HP07_BLUGR|nr:constituent of 66S pre-ribosomal particles [Blumeria graminis f. sp. tritici 96224]VDB88926.1 Bgt-3997 [Blumeria graminis f. sp. tritici]
MDEKARKRKLHELEAADGLDIEEGGKELPKQGMKLPQQKKGKKPKTSKPVSVVESIHDLPSPIKSQDKRQLKQDRKRELNSKSMKGTNPIIPSSKTDSMDRPASSCVDDELVGSNKPENDIVLDEGALNAVVKLDPDNVSPAETTASTISETNSSTFDTPGEPSSDTSTASIASPVATPKQIKIPVDPELLRSRLAARIETLRAARKADGPDGRPARNRQELLEARRLKEEQRRASKKALRLKNKAEEDARREASILSTRNSPISRIMSPASLAPCNNLSFGRISFADGQELTEDLSNLKTAPKKRRSQDTAAALLAQENKVQRMAGLDAEKRADIEEKDLWLNAKKRAHGEKVRDTTSLLKKTLKRKEKAKKKSEKEWSERKEGVAKSQAMKQKKREENLRQRREEKGAKGKGKGKSVKSKKPKVKSRPGFEGSFGSGKRK